MIRLPRGRGWVRGLWLWALVMWSAPAGAQSGTLSGRVTDASGAIIPGATVAATNTATNVSVTGATNREGLYVLSNIPPGRYRVTVEMEGFQTVVRPDVDLHVQDSLAVNFEMPVGSVIQSVTVRAGASLVSTESAVVATLVDRQFVENMPLNGRTFQSLIALVPGVVLTPASGGEQGQFSVNGQRADSNYFTVDGVSANVGGGGLFSTSSGQQLAGTVPGLTTQGGTSNLVSIDALEEFKIQTSSYAPEFGRSPGGQISLVTRSGTNRLHGTAFEYVRNDALDANDWFANSRGLAKPPLRQHDFGGVLGGPVLPNRTFFFGSYEDLELRQPVFAITDVPSLAARERATPAMRTFFNAFPLPTEPARSSGFAEFAASYSNPSSTHSTSVRVDHSATTRVKLFGRYSDGPSASDQRGSGRTFSGNWSLNTVERFVVRNQSLTLGGTQVMTSSATNDVRVNYTRNHGSAPNDLDTFGGAVVDAGSPFLSPVARQAFNLTILGGKQANLSAANSTGMIHRQLNIVDTFSFVAGTHGFKGGVDFRRLDQTMGETYGGLDVNVTFPSLDAAISGTGANVTLLADNGTVHPQFTNASLYVQDTWHTSPRLTVTYGVRWDYNSPPSERNGKAPLAAIHADDLLQLDLAPRGTPLFTARYANLAPRLGLTYTLVDQPGSETVLRGSTGLFYDMGTNTAALSFAGYPNRLIRRLSGVPFPSAVVDALRPEVNPDPPYSLIYLADPHLQLPLTYQWNAALERAMGRWQGLTATYVGAAGRHLLRQERWIKPNPRFDDVLMTRNSGSSDYHSLQLQFQRRLHRGLQALVSYTLAKSLDDASTDAATVAPSERLDPRTNWGPSDFDIRHVFSAAVTYQIPGPTRGGGFSAAFRDWAIDGLVIARSAPPVTVRYFKDIGFGTTSLRPDADSTIPFYLDDPSAPGGRRFNNARRPLAGSGIQIGPFSKPDVLRQGTLDRNALRGFPAWQVDLALRRKLTLTSTVACQFRVECFNCLNHPNFGSPNSVLDNATFGYATEMLASSLGVGGQSGGLNPLYQFGRPRSLQLSLRLQF